MNLQYSNRETTFKDENFMYLLSDPIIAKIFGAILISTIAMATLEPCLPIWLMETLNPEAFSLFYKVLCKIVLLIHHFFITEMANWNRFHSGFDRLFRQYEFSGRSGASSWWHANSRCCFNSCRFLLPFGKFFYLFNFIRNEIKMKIS